MESSENKDTEAQLLLTYKASMNKVEKEKTGQHGFNRVKRNAKNANEPRNFICTICPKRYTKNGHLNDHYTGFHYKDELCSKYGNPDGTLVCIFCGKESRDTVKYAMHVGNVHQKLEDFGIKVKRNPVGAERNQKKTTLPSS